MQTRAFTWLINISSVIICTLIHKRALMRCTCPGLDPPLFGCMLFCVYIAHWRRNIREHAKMSAHTQTFIHVNYEPRQWSKELVGCDYSPLQTNASLHLAHSHLFSVLALSISLFMNLIISTDTFPCVPRRQCVRVRWGLAHMTVQVVCGDYLRAGHYRSFLLRKSQEADIRRRWERR